MKVLRIYPGCGGHKKKGDKIIDALLNLSIKIKQVVGSLAQGLRVAS